LSATPYGYLQSINQLADHVSPHREIPYNCRPTDQYGHDRLLPHNGPTTRLATSLDAEIRPCREEEGFVFGAEEGREMILANGFKNSS
jgi:hypothetical protein